MWQHWAETWLRLCIRLKVRYAHHVWRVREADCIAHHYHPAGLMKVLLCLPVATQVLLEAHSNVSQRVPWSYMMRNNRPAAVLRPSSPPYHHGPRRQRPGNATGDVQPVRIGGQLRRHRVRSGVRALDDRYTCRNSAGYVRAQPAFSMILL